MDDDIETLMIEVRAETSGFRADVETMRGTLDSGLIDGFAKAGNVLERGLLAAIRRGSLGFDDLKNAALNAMNEIAAQALSSGFANLFSGGSGGAGNGLGSFLSSTLGALFGLPGRATGGPVTAGRGYVVGESGPEIFVPNSTGRIEPNMGSGSGARDVRVAINLAAPRGTQAPVALRRSSRQIASTIRRALVNS